MIVPGAAESPIILHVPHASTVIPADVRSGIVLDDDRLAAELVAMTDARTDLIALGAADRLTPRPWAYVNPYSRLVVDPERFPDESEEMNRVGMGAVYTHTSDRRVLRDIPAEETTLLIERYFEPYAAGMADLVADRLRVCGRAVIVDVHSFPSRALAYELHADQQRPPLCIGADDFHTPPTLIDTARTCWQRIGPSLVNQPFAGAYVPLDRYRADRRVVAIMLEIRRDTYLDENHPARPSNLGPVTDALVAFLAGVGALGSAPPPRGGR